MAALRCGCVRFGPISRAFVPGKRLTPVIIILVARDIILAEVAAGLHLDQLELDPAAIFLDSATRPLVQNVARNVSAPADHRHRAGQRRLVRTHLAMESHNHGKSGAGRRASVAVHVCASRCIFDARSARHLDAAA